MQLICGAILTFLQHGAALSGLIWCLMWIPRYACLPEGAAHGCLILLGTMQCLQGIADKQSRHWEFLLSPGIHHACDLALLVCALAVHPSLQVR